MAGRRQVRTGITQVLLPAFLLSALALSLALALTRPVGGWEAASLVATSILLSLCAEWVRGDVPGLFARLGPVTGSASEAVPVHSQLSPDAPGRPRPRAPGRAARARLFDRQILTASL